MADWLVEHHRASAAALHALEVPDDGRRRIWVLDPTAPAVVLGSTQAAGSVDDAGAAAAGVAVVRRRSGGGAVWVAPGDPIWIDVFVPRGDPLWSDDVGRAFLPVGRAWASALQAVGISGLDVHDGPLVRTEWSDVVCFAGRGPGEVVSGDAKVVGLSQRRTRAGARFQCAVHRRWSPEALRGLLRPPPPPGALDGCATGVGPVPDAAVVDGLLAALA